VCGVCVCVCLCVCVLCVVCVFVCVCVCVCVYKRNLLVTEAIYSLSKSEKLFVVIYKLCFNEILVYVFTNKYMHIVAGSPFNYPELEGLVNFLLSSEGQYNSLSFSEGRTQ